MCLFLAPQTSSVSAASWRHRWNLVTSRANRKETSFRRAAIWCRTLHFEFASGSWLWQLWLATLLFLCGGSVTSVKSRFIDIESPLTLCSISSCCCNLWTFSGSSTAHPPSSVCGHPHGRLPLHHRNGRRDVSRRVHRLRADLAWRQRMQTCRIPFHFLERTQCRHSDVNNVRSLRRHLVSAEKATRDSSSSNVLTYSSDSVNFEFFTHRNLFISGVLY